MVLICDVISLFIVYALDGGRSTCIFKLCLTTVFVDQWDSVHHSEGSYKSKNESFLGERTWILAESTSV